MNRRPRTGRNTIQSLSTMKSPRAWFVFSSHTLALDGIRGTVPMGAAERTARVAMLRLSTPGRVFAHALDHLAQRDAPRFTDSRAELV